MSQATFFIGDVFAVMKTLPDASVDTVITSPPFLALRSYLPDGHPDKDLEIGSEPTPAAFLDTLLALTAEWRRLLAPHGSIAVELGDTYSGVGGSSTATNPAYGCTERALAHKAAQPAGSGKGWRKADDLKHWPLAKSLALIPELYRIALAYGINPLTGQPSPAGRWRVRNVVDWCLDGDTVVYARTPKGEGPTRLLHLTQNWKPGQWDLWDGIRWTPVLGWSTSEADDAIEIEFRNGERISATRNHQWPTARGLLRTDELQVGDVVDQVRLPEPTRDEPAHLPDEDIGWLVGTFIADGSFDSRDRIQIAGHRDEAVARMARLTRLAADYDASVTSHDIGEGNESVVVLRSHVLAAVLRRYVGGDSARNKCLKAPAWRRSNRFLAAVVDGYLSGDGHYDAKNDRWRLGFTDNGWLARDLRVLSARLGYSCRIRRLPRAADPRGGQFAGTARFWHRGEIRLAPGPLVKAGSEIVALRQSRRRRFFDVGVEGEPHLFALGSGILTHNCRPNPPVGALGDKFRPATSDLVIACTSKDRWFDLDAVRTAHGENATRYDRSQRAAAAPITGRGDAGRHFTNGGNPAGAPPLDWWDEIEALLTAAPADLDHRERARWVRNRLADTYGPADAWEIAPGGYTGSHYAVFPPELLIRPIKAMCPAEVCRVCGEPRRRIVETSRPVAADDSQRIKHANGKRPHTGRQDRAPEVGWEVDRITLGFTDCGHGDYRPGIVLDPFGGSGTTGLVATGHGRDAWLIDLDERNADLARERIGMFLEVVDTREQAA